MTDKADEASAGKASAGKASAKVLLCRGAKNLAGFGKGAGRSAEHPIRRHARGW